VALSEDVERTIASITPLIPPSVKVVRKRGRQIGVSRCSTLATASPGRRRFGCPWGTAMIAGRHRHRDEIQAAIHEVNHVREHRR